MISVIVPAYNSEKTIGSCLKSLAEQDYRGKYEIIVADDGSTDGTPKIVKQFPSVKLLKADHKGPAGARNAGAKSAKGSIILFTDSDCTPARDWISHMTKTFEDAKVAGVQGAYKTTQRSLVARFAQLEIEERYRRLLRSEYPPDWIGSYAAGYRKAIFFRFGGFDEGYTMASGEDPDLSYKMIKAGLTLGFNPSAIVYHTHPESPGKYFKQKMWRAAWRIKLYARNRGKIVSEAYTPPELKAQIALFYAFALSALLLPVYNTTLPLIAAPLLFLASTIRLTAENMKDMPVGILTPLFVLSRTTAFVIGLSIGLILFATGKMKG